MAPVTPELQWEPKLIHEIRRTAHSFAQSGGGFFPSLESVSDSSGVWMSRTGSETASTDFETEVSTAIMTI